MSWWNDKTIIKKGEIRMEVTIEMAASINGLIATKEGSEDFLSERNYQIMLDFLKEYDCLVWGNKTFQNGGYLNSESCYQKFPKLMEEV